MRVNIHKLRQDFDKNPKISNIDSTTISNDAHAVACVLKQYFRELPIPLLTFHMYEKFIELFKHSAKATNLITTTTLSPQTTRSINFNYDNANQKQADKTHESSNQKLSCDTSNRQSVETTSPEERNPCEQPNEPSAPIEHDNKSLSICNYGLSKDELDRSASVNEKPESALKVHRECTTGESESLGKNDGQPRKAQVQRGTNDAIVSSTTSPKIETSIKYSHVLPSSSSNSQLVSLSSIVQTTASDVKYQVRLDELRRLLLKLPKTHYRTLKYLMRHLAFIAANGNKTGMDSKNVAIVWAPNLLKPPELELSAGLETLQVIGLQAVITEQLIKHHKFLFDDDEDIAEVNNIETEA